MYLCGYSIDNLSLMALTLSVGFVVDDAIVMLENIVRHMEQGEGAMEAAINGSGEIGFTILSVDAVAFSRVYSGAVHGGSSRPAPARVRGDHHDGHPGVGFVSLTLTPMLCSRFLKPHHEVRHGWLYNFFVHTGGA